MADNTNEAIGGRANAKGDLSPKPGGRGDPGPDRVPMEVNCRVNDAAILDRNLRSRLMGQDHAVETLVCSYARLLSGLRDPARPLLTSLLLGPTGVGKTETAKGLAYTLFGSDRALTRINAEEYTHGHELSKLFGSPPGYVGHDIEPLLSQNSIDEHHRRLREAASADPVEDVALADHVVGAEENRYHAIILFDEIEKAHPKVWSALLGILDEGMLTLGNNQTTDFTRSIILMTSNVGSREMSELLEKRPIGFRNSDGNAAGPPIRETALSAARGMFPLEFLNRFDEILVYSALTHDDMEQIFDKFLADIQQRTVLQARVPLMIQVTPAARERIIEEGTDLRYGARPLRRAIEHRIVDPLSRLIAAGELKAGDVVEVDLSDAGLEFYRRSRSSTVTVARPADDPPGHQTDHHGAPPANR